LASHCGRHLRAHEQLGEIDAIACIYDDAGCAKVSVLAFLLGDWGAFGLSFGRWLAVAAFAFVLLRGISRFLV
jgi:hypothetical protein